MPLPLENSAPSSGGYVIPPEPGTAPILAGNARLYHYTGADPEQIRQQGLRLDQAKGESYGEPNQIWASARPPSLDNHNVVEFHVPVNDPRWQIGRYEPYINYGEGVGPENYGQYLHDRGAHVTFQGDIRPDEIAAVHEPWHQSYRYMMDNYPKETTDPSEFDWTQDEAKGGSPELGQAVKAWKNTHWPVTSAVEFLNNPSQPLGEAAPTPPQLLWGRGPDENGGYQPGESHDPYWDRRQPFLYYPKANSLVLGQPGQHHLDLINDHPQLAENKKDWAEAGEVWNHRGYPEVNPFWGGPTADQVFETIKGVYPDARPERGYEGVADKQAKRVKFAKELQSWRSSAIIDTWQFPLTSPTIPSSGNSDERSSSARASTHGPAQVKNGLKASWRLSAASPTWMQTLIANQGPYLYHRTLTSRGPAILTQGLQPDSPSTNLDPTWKARPGHTYLGTREAAEQAARWLPYEEPQSLFQIDLRHLDPQNLNPDEDAFIGAAHHTQVAAQKGFPNYPAQDLTRPPPGYNSFGEWGAGQGLNQPEHVAHSFQHTGSISHQGAIPPQAIQEIERYDPNDEDDNYAPERTLGAWRSLARSWDPTVCEQCGGRMSEPSMVGSQYMNHCLSCGSSREVPFSSPFLQQKRQQDTIQGYPPELQAVGPERPWVFAKEAAPTENQLWWEPGVAGRGFVQQSNGLVHHWPELEGGHMAMAEAKSIPWEDIRGTSFTVRPDGTTIFPYLGGLKSLGQDFRSQEQGLMQQVQAADPRLQPRPFQMQAKLTEDLWGDDHGHHEWGEDDDAQLDREEHQRQHGDQYYHDWANDTQGEYEERQQQLLDNGELYHAAPTQERDRILQHGLQPSSPAWSTNWGNNEFGKAVRDEFNRALEDQPTGVYMSTDPLSTAHDIGNQDIWKIDPQYVKGIEPDDVWGGAQLTRHVVPPEALTLHQPFEHTWHRPDEGGVDEGAMWRERDRVPFHPEWGIGKPNQVWGKLGAEQYYYHAAPSSERERIMAHGLHPAKPSWENYTADRLDNPTQRMEEQPIGVYVMRSPRGVQPYTEWGPHDVWRIPRSAVQEIVPDRMSNGAYIPHPVPAELHSTKDDNTKNQAWWQHDGWGPSNAPELYEGVQFPDYWKFENSQVTPEMGIGKPNQVWGKLADLYHVAPTMERNRIKQHGLQVADPYHEWGPEMFDDEYGVDNFRPPKGVYGFPQLPEAQDWAGKAEHGDPTGMHEWGAQDIWRIPDGHTHPDPDIPGARYHEYPVEYPILHEGPEHRPGSGWGQPLGSIKTSDKLHDFLMNPKSRPDLQTPEGQGFLKHLETHYHNEKTDALMPWLTREWKKGRVTYKPRASLAPGDLPEAPRYPRLLVDRDHEGRLLRPEDLNHWGDFMRSNHPVRRGLGDIMQHDVNDFYDNHVGAWDDAMKAEAHQRGIEGGEVVHTTPEGYTVRKLTTPEELKAEGDAMGHCVGGYHQQVANGDSLIYSLRDPSGASHATTEIEPTHYDSPETGGVTDEQYGGDQGREQNYPIPHRGNVVQIQGKGNDEPNDEYKQQLAHWFGSFPDEDRPQRQFAQWNDGDEGELTDAQDIEPHHLRGPGVDAYGLNAIEPDIHWRGLLDSTIGMHSYRGYSDYDPRQGEAIHGLAKAWGQMPQFGDALENFSHDQQENFDNWKEENFVNFPEYPQEEDYPKQDEHGDDISYDDAMQDYENEDNAWAADHPGMQATNHMYSLIMPHWDHANQTFQNAHLQQQPDGVFR